MQNLRMATQEAIKRGDWHDRFETLSYSRGELAKYISNLEDRSTSQMNEKNTTDGRNIFSMAADDCSNFEQKELVCFDVYQNWTRQVATYPDLGTGSTLAISYCVCGLTGESGEVSNKYKKVLRGDYFAGVDFRKHALAELGDVLWYVARTADELGLSFSEIVRANIAKLHARKAAGTLQGSGDSR